MIARTWRVLVATLLVVTAAHAQEPTVEVVDHAFARWMKEHGVQRGQLALARGDRLVLAKGYGGATASQRGLIASLSKPITAACIATLIQDGRLRFETTLGELLPAQYGEPRDPRLRAVTIAQLLTHRSGFGRKERGDPATGSALAEVLGRTRVTLATMHDLVPGVLRRTLDHEPGSTYAYTNASHLLLGIVIEALTSRTYADYCGTAILKAHGITDPRLHERWHILGSFGGWSLSGPEYLAFLRDFAPGATFFSAETRRWIESPASKETSAAGPLFYSFLFVRPLPSGGHNFFHVGSWGYRSGPGTPSGRIDDSIGTLAVSAALGASWFVWYEPRPRESAREALDVELHRAVASVRRWPDGNLYGPLGLR